MSTLYFFIVTLLVVVGIFKIVWIWTRQVVKILTNDIPYPGIPWPMLGHSQLFINVQPGDVQDVVQNLIKQDTKCRKVSLRSYHIKSFEEITQDIKTS